MPTMVREERKPRFAPQEGLKSDRLQLIVVILVFTCFIELGRTENHHGLQRWTWRLPSVFASRKQHVSDVIRWLLRSGLT